MARGARSWLVERQPQRRGGQRFLYMELTRLHLNKGQYLPLLTVVEGIAAFLLIVVWGEIPS